MYTHEHERLYNRETRLSQNPIAKHFCISRYIALKRSQKNCPKRSRNDDQV